MSIQSPAQTLRPSHAAPPKLVCRLRRKEGWAGGRPAPPGAGEVELENASPTDILIEASMSPLQHLDLVVTDATGRVVSSGRYGDFFSPLAQPYQLRLRPGEKYRQNVSLLATVPEGRRRPGERYTVRAVYDCEHLRAVSEPLDVEWPSER